MERTRFLSLHRVVPRDMLSSETNLMLDVFEDYFKTYPDDDMIDLDALTSLVSLRQGISRETVILLNGVIKQLGKDVPEHVLTETANRLETLAFSGRANLLLQRYANGEEVDLTHELLVLSQTTRKRIELTSQSKWADGDVWEYIQRDADDSGYKFDIFPKISENLKGLNGGDNVCIAAPTDKGKTSLLCNVAVSFARQEWLLRGEQSRPVLYLVNEGLAERITPRVYQTALHCTRDELWEKGRNGTITKEYEAIVGRRDMIRLVNVHGMNISQIVRVIEQHNPFLVITDMTGRILAQGVSGANDTALLEQVWNDMRSLAAIHNFIHVGTAQISAEGMDNLFPPLTAIQNSKVGIQTTWDLAVYVGALQTTDAGLEFLRGISTPKNKLARSGKPVNTKVEVILNPHLNTWS